MGFGWHFSCSVNFMNSPRVLKVWSLVLMVQSNEFGLGFWFLCLKKEKEREGARKTRKKVSRRCVLLKSPVCFPWSSCLFLPSFTSWRSLNLPSLTATYLLRYLRVMKSTLHADNTAFLVKLKNNTGSWVRLIVRSDRPALAEWILEVGRQTGSLVGEIQILKL